MDLESIIFNWKIYGGRKNHFYLVLFENFIFRLKEPTLIFVGMLILCIVISILINHIEKLIVDGVKFCRT